MSALRSLVLGTTLTFVAPFGLLTPSVSAQTNTLARAPAKAKKAPPKKKAPVRKPANEDVFAPVVPDDTTWFDSGEQKVAPSDDGSDWGSGDWQLGLMAAVAHFGQGMGVEGGYPIWDKLRVGGRLLQTSASLEDKATEGAQEFVSAKSLSIKALALWDQFPYFSFGGGFGLTRSTGNYGWRGTSVVGQELKTDFTATIATAEIVLRSEYKLPWYGIYVGADWLGFAFPLGGNIEYSDFSDLEQTTKTLKGDSPNQRLDEEISAQLGLYYLNLSVGVRF